MGALRFDATGTVIDAYPILKGTNVNCAGGPTPWDTWLSCEEFANGRVFETDPWGAVEAIERPSLVRFKHEAATVDPEYGGAYLSEDETDGRLYRFQSSATDEHGHPSLTEGVLQVAVVDTSGTVTWRPIPDPLAEHPTPAASSKAHRHDRCASGSTSSSECSERAQAPHATLSGRTTMDCTVRRWGLHPTYSVSLNGAPRCTAIAPFAPTPESSSVPNANASTPPRRPE